MRPLSVEFLASMPTLAMGCSFFVWIPLCVAFGRRPIVIAASLMLTLACLSAGFATAFHPLLVAICFVGFAGGATIGTVSLPSPPPLFSVPNAATQRPPRQTYMGMLTVYGAQILLQIIDLTYIHERPLAIAGFWVIGGFLALVPLGELPSMMDTTIEWRPPFKAASIAAAVITLLILFFVPETYFRRPPVAFDGRVLVQSGAEKVSIYDEWRDVPAAAESNNNNNNNNRSSSSVHSYRDSSGTMSSTRALDPSSRCQRDPRPRRRARESWLVAPLALWRRSIADPRAAVACFVQVFLCLANPLVFWVALLNAVNFGGMMSIGTGFPVLLAQPPYNLSRQAIGHVNTTAAVASLLALPAMYAALEGAARWRARRNRGVRHAEFYLPAFALPVATGAASVLLYGCAAGGGWHPVVYHAAYGLNAFSFTAGAIANTVWVTESLPRWAAPGLAVVGGVSYMASWAITAALPTWVRAWGVVAVNVGIGSLMLVVGLLAIPLAFWGKSVRQFIHGRWGASEVGALRPQWRAGEGG